MGKPHVRREAQLKLERYHRTAKASVNVFVHHSPDEPAQPEGQV